MTETPVVVPDQVLQWARAARQISVLTGAGMSAESGIATFRDTQTGLWSNIDPMKVATPEGWAADPPGVWAWYAWRLGQLKHVEPNAGHIAIGDWSKRATVHVITQNVDDLHERGGCPDVVHLHGNLTSFRCFDCGAPYDGPLNLPEEPVETLQPITCAQCGGDIRPGVVWFGENLPEGAFDRAMDLVLASDLVLVVGTSGIVYPAAVLPDLARGHGIPVVEINPDPTAPGRGVDHCWVATAANALPALVAAL